MYLAGSQIHTYLAVFAEGRYFIRYTQLALQVLSFGEAEGREDFARSRLRRRRLPAPPPSPLYPQRGSRSTGGGLRPLGLFDHPADHIFTAGAMFSQPNYGAASTHIQTLMAEREDFLAVNKRQAARIKELEEVL